MKMASLRRLLFAAMAMVAVVGFAASAYADERDLVAKSSALITAEVDGLGAPDANFVIASVDVGAGGLIDQLSKKSPIGDQGKTQIVQRSSGCSTGCSNGCSTGCSNGCSSGCSVGCSVGCR